MKGVKLSDLVIAAVMFVTVCLALIYLATTPAVGEPYYHSPDATCVTD